MVEQVVVWSLVGGVVLLVARRLRRILAGNGGGCGCGSGACRLPSPCDQSECDQSVAVTVERGKTLISVGTDVFQGGHEDP